MVPDLAPDPDPTPDPTLFFIDFKAAKKIFFFIFLLITCPQAHHLQFKKLNLVLKFYLQALFQSA
jgi:hypothetical protein